MSLLAPSATGTTTSPASALVRGASAAIAARAVAASVVRLGSATRSSITSPPRRAFSSSAVPSAISEPWSITAMRSAS